MQCDIDILGEASNLAEIELILATTTLLGRLEFKNFTIRINDRRILKAMAAYSGFPEESYDTVFIILDKMDKIGMEGVSEELKGEGFPAETVEKYLELFKAVTADTAGVAYLKDLRLPGSGVRRRSDHHYEQRGGGEIRGFPHRLRSHSGPGHVLLHRPHF